MVEFVSYDGGFPCLCDGRLTIRVDGIEHTLPPNSLTSGGCAWIGDDGKERIKTGDWVVKIPWSLKQYEQEIIQCVNQNVPHGCCGGCI